ncbi:MAG: TetR/AcrR family transcriptional regulator [Gemmatimonadaceae bacterium]|nr:TetR/AcrR family transcriptional regulator [Gemmatimonadaceae bacterium]
MPRERTFTEADVIDCAADLFAVHGYGGTSVSMLTDATGLGKQSLYNAFGDKQALYLQAMECAVARYGAVAARMTAAPDGRTALALFCEHLVTLCASGEPARQACIVSSGLLEGIDDPAIRATLRTKWHATHELLRAHVERGQRDGSIANPTPSATLADLFMSMMSGLRVASRADASPARLSAITHLNLALLDHR